MLAMWAAALWGLAGGLCVEALELYARIKRAREWSWRKPIPQGRAAYWTSVVIRAGVGALVAAAAAASGQVSGAFAALSFGVGAPLVLEKIIRLAAAAAGQAPQLDPGAPVVEQVPAPADGSTGTLPEGPGDVGLQEVADAR